MKTQILLTVELNDDAMRREYSPVAVGLSPTVVLEIVNDGVRDWEKTNPFGLREPEHCAVRLALTSAPASAAESNVFPKLAHDLMNMANDLTTLANTISYKT